MKHLFVLLSLISLLSSCSENQTNQEPITTVANDITESNVQAQPVIEYVWHKKGANFSEDALNAAIDQWNAFIDQGEYQIQFANILMADQPNEDMDFMWSILWDSMAARNAGWQYWQQNQESQWQSMTSELLTYSEEHAYAFAPTVQRSASAESDSKSFRAQYAFCNFNDGYSQIDLAQFQTAYHAWIDAYERDNGPTGYWYVDLAPQFESEASSDFVWLHLWADLDEQTTGITDFGQSPLAAQVAAMSTCQNYDFTGQGIRG